MVAEVSCYCLEINVLDLISANFCLGKMPQLHRYCQGCSENFTLGLLKSNFQYKGIK